MYYICTAFREIEEMQSFRTEIENPLVEKDIIELEKKIKLFRDGKIDDDRFRSLRLARGVYGQRQQGVQMVRIKLPYGKVTFKQWLRIAEVADEYSTGKIHLTTRQDVQIHHVSLDRTPELWAELERDEITLREACGNTVRNIIASPEAGIVANEPFDVSSYAEALFRYFLRNPVCQDMGRKIKMSFSANDDDTAYSFIHDLGFIPKIQNGVKGFKVMLGGGLGAQPSEAIVAKEFLPVQWIIPFTESVLKVFDRNGERANRNKARMKFLVKKIGADTFLELVEQEFKLKDPVEIQELDYTDKFLDFTPDTSIQPLSEPQTEAYKTWKATNVFAQKQEGFFGVWVKVRLGDMSTQQVRQFVNGLHGLIANDTRVTPNQGILLKFVKEEYLPNVYAALLEAGVADAGFASTADITACPGTDTCNLGISNSTHVSKVLEEHLVENWSSYISNKQFDIKISGCMNSCGQHAMAALGFHGSSIKGPKGMVPALQVLLGGGNVGNGKGIVSDKVIKVPSKMALDVLDAVLTDFETNKDQTENYQAYYNRQGKDYFYQLLKPFADLEKLSDSDYLDWGQDEKFKPQIGVGECAGVTIDLVSTLLFESDEKIEAAEECIKESRFGDAAYHVYASLVNTAKALLVKKGVRTNTHSGIISDFVNHYPLNELLPTVSDFEKFVFQLDRKEFSETFTVEYLSQAKGFLAAAKVLNEQGNK